MIVAFPNYGKEKPEYILLLTEYLTMWPLAIVEPVLNPFTGIASRVDFPPSISEMRQALEDEVARQKQEQNRRDYPVEIVAAPPATDKLQRWRYL